MAAKDGSEKSCWLGFDLGGTKMQAVVFDGFLKPVAREKKKTKASDGTDEVLGRILKTIDDALAQAKLTREAVAGIGIGVPGTLDLDKGVIKSAPNLGWTNVALRDYLQKQVGCAAVVINDVDAGVYGEYVAGAGKGGRCVLGIFPGTGIGGGLVYKGELFTGEKTSCLEIGHVQVLPDGPLCGCGKRGCLEAVASRLAIAAGAAIAAGRGQAPNLLKAAGTDVANIRSGVLAEAIAAGDKAVEQIVRQTAQWLGKAIAMCVNLLSPDIILLGGGTVEAMPDIYRKEVEAAVSANIMDAYQKTYRVVVAALGDDATVTGAAAWARRTFEQVQAQAVRP